MANFHNVAPLPGVFPYTMMRYITKDPPRTADTQRKLIKVCKFFYNKHRIIPVMDVLTFITNNYYILNDGGMKTVKGTLDVSYEFKLWLDFFLNFRTMDISLTDFLSNVYRCDLKEIFLHRCEITYDDFMKLQFQVGEIIACEEVPKSKKLLC